MITSIYWVPILLHYESIIVNDSPKIQMFVVTIWGSLTLLLHRRARSSFSKGNCLFIYTLFSVMDEDYLFGEHAVSVGDIELLYVRFLQWNNLLHLFCKSIWSWPYVQAVIYAKMASYFTCNTLMKWLRELMSRHLAVQASTTNEKSCN